MIRLRFKYIINTSTISKDLIANNVKLGDIVLDCTVGNGNDTLELAKLVGPNGKVYGFDIQSNAISITKNLLEVNNLLDRVNLINDSHENILDYIDESLDFIVYNLGYLPKGDKSIKTSSVSTVKSLRSSISLLSRNGLLIVTAYTRHHGGLEEKQALEKFLSNLDQKKFNTLKYEFINQKNNPPILYAVERSK